MMEQVNQQRLKQLDESVEHLKALYEQEREENATKYDDYDKLQTEYRLLAEKLQRLNKLWEEREVEFERQRQHLDRLQQGRREMDQIWRTRLIEVSSFVLSAVKKVPAALASLRSRLLSEGGIGWKQEALAGVDTSIRALLAMVEHTIPYAPQEGNKVTLEELQSSIADLADEGDRTPSTNGVEFERRLFEQLHEKIEMLATENRSKYREIRYMKSLVAYLSKTADEVISGTYDHSKDSEAPREDQKLSNSDGIPSEVAREDKDYAYAWIDERKLLAELLTKLKLYVTHGGAKPNSVNSLLGVLGSWREQLNPGTKEARPRRGPRRHSEQP